MYNIQKRTKQEIATATRRYEQQLAEWESSLPLHLGKIKPSSLVPEFRRQAVALKLAFAHARMHLQRPYLLGNMNHSNDGSHVQHNITDCLTAAQDALQIVNSMALDGSLINSLWWMYYVAFCALSVVYIWEIQQKTQATTVDAGMDMKILLDLADQCHTHLAQKAPANSPSRAYSIVLEELREEAKQRASQQMSNNLQGDEACGNAPAAAHGLGSSQNMDLSTAGLEATSLMPDGDISMTLGPNIWDGWSTTDWLDFDSSVSRAVRHGAKRSDFPQAYLPLYDLTSDQFEHPLLQQH